MVKKRGARGSVNDDNNRSKDTAITESSGNVFADLGFAQPEEELTKAQLASQLRQIVKRRRLTQSAAAELMGIDQPKVSALINGRLANFSSERLMRLLTALGHDVEITVADEPRVGAPGRIRVSGASEAARRPPPAAATCGFGEAEQADFNGGSDASREHKRRRQRS